MYVVSSDGTMKTVSSRRCQVSIHECHLELVLEVRHGAQTANDQIRTNARRKVHEQSVELANVHACVVTDGRANERDALLQREQRLLRDVRCDGDHDAIDEREASA